MFPVREHLALAREVRAAAIDEINARKIILPRNLLRAQMLLDGERIISAAFHGRVIGNDDAFLAADPSNTADQSGRREIILINLITRKLRELQKGCTRIELRVAQKPPGRELVDIAIAAEKLNRIECRPRRMLGSKEKAAGGILARDMARVAGAGNSIGIGAARVEARVHIGELALNELKLANRLTELLSLAHIGQANVETGLHDAERSARNHDTLEIEPRRQNSRAIPRGSKDVFFRHFAIFKEKLGGRRATHAKLIELLAGTKALEAAFDDKSRNPARPRLGIGLGVDNENRGIGPVGDPHLSAVQDIVAASLIGAQPHRNDIGPGAGF